MRLLGAVVPDFPSAEAGTIEGKPTVPRAATDNLFKNTRRLIFFGFISFPFAYPKLMDFFIKMKVTKKKRLLTANILFKTGVFFNKYELFAFEVYGDFKSGAIFVPLFRRGCWETREV
jgi:hypothetical protein